jgi:hypothetical protein
MSKPLSKKQIENMMVDALTINSRSPMADVDSDTLHDECRLLSCHIGALVQEVKRLQKLAKPNRKPKTRNTVRHINTTARRITIDERGGGYGYEIDNPDYGKVCPCKDCKESGGKRFTMQALIDKARAYDGRLG